VTEIIDCVRPHPSKWYVPGHHAFALANSRRLPFVRWKGQQGLRNAPPELLELLDFHSATDAAADALAI
jgi:hypothetical protein